MQTICDSIKDSYATIVAIGDSITAVNSSTQGQLNWVGLLQMGLNLPKGYLVINSGNGGDSLAQGLARLERDVLRFSPTLVIISFGINDAMGGVPLEKFTADLRTMISRIRAQGGKILLRTPNPVLDAATGGESVDFRYEPGVPPRPYDVGAYAAAIVRVAEEEKTLVVDHYSLWKASMSTVYRGEMRYLMSDCIHPNGSGHRRFYHELAPVFGVEPFFQHDWQHILCQSAPVL